MKFFDGPVSTQLFKGIVENPVENKVKFRNVVLKQLGNERQAFERGFSYMKHMKSDWRASLKPDTIYLSSFDLPLMCQQSLISSQKSAFAGIIRKGSPSYFQGSSMNIL